MCADGTPYLHITDGLGGVRTEPQFLGGFTDPTHLFDEGAVFDDTLDLREQVRVVALPTYAGPVDAPLLAYASDGAAGVELYAAEDVVIRPGERALVHTGISVALPDAVEMQVRAKSGRALKEGLGLTNSIGTIDPDYRGEVGVIVQNLNPVLTLDDLHEAERLAGPGQEMRYIFRMLAAQADKRSISITRGQKVAQGVFAYFVRPVIVPVDALDATARGEGAYGSTGV